MRKLATIRKISDIRPINGADAIDCAVVDGWTVVVKKGEFSVGALAVYFEIDSWIPTTLAPFLSRSEPREYHGVKGERLRTIKLRGQLSQGLLLPVSAVTQDGVDGEEYPFIEGSDVTELLGVQKWERELPAQLRGMAKGNFPSFIPKTDQERCQNLVREIADNHGETFEVTVKLDGSSMTVYKNGDDVGVCSRNLELKLDQDGNTFVDTAKQSGVLGYLQALDRDIAIQGELMGPGIQGNRESFAGFYFFVFDVWLIGEARYMTPSERQALDFSALVNVVHVPVVDHQHTLTMGVPELLVFAEGQSVNHAVREGLVFKRTDGKFSFKAISNKFLLKEF